MITFTHSLFLDSEFCIKCQNLFSMKKKKKTTTTKHKIMSHCSMLKLSHVMHEKDY